MKKLPMHYHMLGLIIASLRTYRHAPNTDLGNHGLLEMQRAGSSFSYDGT